MLLRATRLSAIANAVRNLFRGASLNMNFAGTDKLDPRITFSRASNATVTGPDGTLGYAPHNLLTHSEQFDNGAWTKTALTSTGNATAAPNGTITADKVAEDSTNGFHFVQQVGAVSAPAGVKYTFSVSVKAAGRSFAFIGISGTAFGAPPFLSVNLSTGAATIANGGTFNFSVLPEENGFWRVSVTGETALAGTVQGDARPSIDGVWSSRSYQGDGTSGLFLWGAQLNIGTLQPYYPTTVKNLLGYTQEFDNAAWTKSNAFVQTNLLTFSEQFDNAVWLKSNATVTANAITAPDGTLTADKLVEDVQSTEHYVRSTAVISPAGTYTASAYWHQSSERNLYLRVVHLGEASATSQVTFNKDTLTLSLVSGNAISASASDVGGGWWRVSLVFAITTTRHVQHGMQALAGAAAVYTGDGASGIYIWGAQLVQGSAPGDYQRTEAAAKAVMYPAPDGSLTADKLVEDTANGSHDFFVQTTGAISGTVYTTSLYVKASERSVFRLTARNSGFGFVASGVFNLATQIATPVVGSPTLQIVPVGNGWFRCSLTVAASGTTFGTLFQIDNGTTAAYTGDGTSGIFIWGAQLSDSASLDPYVYNPAAAPAASAYYGPRFDYDPVTLAPKGLLIEEQRTNSIRNSTMQGAVAGTPGTLPTNWSAFSSTNGIIREIVGVGAEDGINYIDFRFFGTPTTGSQYVDVTLDNLVSASNGQAWTSSAYLRVLNGSLNGLQSIIILYETPSFNNSGTGLGGVTNAPLRTQRVSHTRTLSNATTTAVSPRVAFTVPAGAAIDITLRIGMPQLEQGAFATSVIPTTTAAATRAADVATMTGANFSNWYRQDEGTLFSEFSVFGVGSASNFNGAAVVDDGTVNNAMELAMWDAAADSLRWVGYVGGTAQWSINPKNYSTPSVTKGAGAYRANSFNGAFDGVLGAEDTAGSVPVVSTLRLGANRGGSGNYLNGHLRRIAFYPRRLTNSELQGLTS